MKETREFESGRSMSEMVGVLIVIGILTIASLGGFSFVIRTWRQRQTIDQINAIAVNMRAGNISQRYAAAERVPVRSVVRGLKTKSGLNDAASLPDDEDSYALVTSFGANKYMLEVQVTPGTCEEFLDKLSDPKQSGRGLNPDIVTICDGDLDVHGNCSGESATLTKALEDAEAEDRTREATLTSLCSTQPKTALYWGCRQGTSDYFWGGDCHQCPKSTPKWDGYRCCEALGADGRCPDSDDDCPAERPHWWAEGKKCVECLENADCPDTIFSEHVCDKKDHTCVECFENEHCGKDTPNLAKDKCDTTHTENCVVDASPRDDDWRKMKCNSGSRSCYQCMQHSECPVEKPVELGKTEKWTGVCLKVEAVCAECSMSYNGGSLEYGECPASLPVCNSPSTVGAYCGQCPEGRIWSVSQQRCSCPSDKPIEHDGECFSCVDWKALMDANEGCAPVDPHNPKALDTCIIDLTEEPNVIKHGCHECATDYEEAHKGEAAYCSKSLPVCDNRVHNTDNNPSYECYRCINDQKGDDIDTGCDPDHPLCDGDEGKYGNVCMEQAVCYNTEPEAQPDWGCESDPNLPMCNTTVDQGPGTACKHCINDKPGDALDTGCDAASDQPMCGAADQKFGMNCYRCINDNSDTQKDTGCSPETPLCDAEEGQYGNACLAKAVCYNTKPEAQTDLGCEGDPNLPMCNTTEDQGPGTACMHCLNDNPGDALDTGCNAASDQPMCDAADQEFGMNCYRCINDNPGTKKDTGCSPEAPVCDAEEGQYGNTCSAKCSGSSCWDPQAQTCINPNDYDDLYTDDSGMCQCYGSVRTKNVNDMKHCTVYDNYGKKQAPSDGDIYDKHLEETDKTWHNSPVSGWEREREYKIPVNFYCARYMHVSKDMEADDFVSGSYPEGIGVDSPANPSKAEGKMIKTRHINTITPKVSSTTIQGKDTAVLRVKDRWLGDVGLSTGGYFYFTTEVNSGTSSPKKLSVEKGWSENMTPEAKADAEKDECRHKVTIRKASGEAQF